MIIGDNMETLNQYFTYENDYSSLNDIFINLSRKLKFIHEDNMIIPRLNGDSILYDDGTFSFTDQESTDNVVVGKRKNIISLAKIMLGAYLSLSTGFKDFSNVDDAWFLENLEDICSSITSEDFERDYFRELLLEGKDEYYSDYYDRKKQNESLSERSNVQGYKKVLKTAASSLYEEQVFDEEDDLNIEKKTASINIMYFPILIGGLITFGVFLYLMINLIN
jgi:hypothetical protein